MYYYKLNGLVYLFLLLYFKNSTFYTVNKEQVKHAKLRVQNYFSNVQSIKI